MSQVIDNKVVQMDFDNSKFENNVQTSMSTLDKLKKSLNMDGASKGLNDVNNAAKNMDLSGIAAGVEAIQNRFSTMGIVGMTVIQNLTTSVMNLGAKMVNFAKDSIVGGGMRRAQNIENAHFMLQGLLKDEEKVQAVMDKAMVSVDQTAYGYDEAAKAAAMFTASGLTIKQLDRPLRAITGVAAMTNSEYEGISQIFTTVAGNGRLMGDQLLQLSSKGLNAAATIADYFNATSKGSKKTEKDIREMVSEGKIDFKTFATAMDWAFGKQAKRANETVNGVVSNIKAAFSRIGADFISPLIEQNGPLVKLLNEVREQLNRIRKVGTSPAAAEITKQINKTLTGLRHFLHSAEEYGGMITWLGKSILELFRIIGDVASIGYRLFRPFVTAIGDVLEPSRHLAKLFWAIRTVLDVVKNSISDLVQDNLAGILSNIAYILGTILHPLYEFIMNFAKGAKNSDKFRTILEKVTGVLFDFTDKLADGVDKLKGFSNPFAGFIKKIANAFGMLFEAIKRENVVDKVKNVFHDLVEAIKNAIHDTFGELELDDKVNLINGGVLLAGIKVVYDLIKKFRALKFGGFKLEGLEKIYRLFSNDLRDTLFEYQRKLKADQLISIAKAIAILAASLMLLSLIKPTRLASGLAGLSTLFGMLSAFFILFNGESMIGLKGIGSQASYNNIGKMIIALNGIATAILIISGALKVISTIDPDALGASIAAIGVLLLELGIFVKQISMNEKATIKGAGALISLSVALLIMSVAVKRFADIEPKSLAMGLLGIAASLATILLTMKLMPEKGMISTGVGLIAVAAGLLIISKVLKSLGELDDGVLNRGLGGLAGLLMGLAIALQVMKGTLSGSAALIIAAVAIGMMVPMLKILSGMSWESIFKGLIALAGAFTVIGVAGKLLAPVIGTLLAFAGVLVGISAAVALFGAGLMLIGAGFTAISVGLTALAGAMVARASAFIGALKIVFIGLIELIPSIITALVTGLVNSIEVILEFAPKIVNGIWRFVLEILKGLDQYIPQIAETAISLLIKIINVIASKTPELISAFANLVAAIFNSLAEAFKNADTESLLKGVVAVGLMAGLTYILSGIVSLIPMAMVGLAGVGALIAELSLILAGIGKLSEISGLQWLVSEGGNFLQIIGTAIGKFIGGIAGGITEGVSAALPTLGTNLSAFMTNLKPFLDGASTIDPMMAEGVKALAAAIMIITAADILERLTSWLTGGVNLGDFAAQLVPFGQGIAQYSQAVAGVDAKAVKASALAAKAIVQLAQAIPNSGGVWSIFSGDNDIGSFAKKLVPFGQSMKAYADTVVGLDVMAVQNAEKAIKSLVNAVNATAKVDTSGVSSFKSAVSSLAQTQANEMSNAFRSSAAGVKSAGSAITSALRKGISSGKGELTSAASSMVSGLGAAFSSNTSGMTSAGSKLISALIKGFRGGRASATANAKAVVSGMINAVNGQSSAFYKAGSNMADGLADGIASGKSQVIEAAIAIATAAITAAKLKLKINSPSKEFAMIGSGVVEGFVKGIGDNISYASSASETMAGKSINSFSKALSSLNALVGDELDADPTIRPVLDLSGVQEGSSYISNMLDMAGSIGLDANTGAINNLMNQNARSAVTNSDVVSAINKLSRNLGNVGGDTYNIDGITYDDGSNVQNAIETLVNAAVVARRS